MANQNATMTFLRLIGDHDCEWGWYQFERAFPPGWFVDEKPTATAKEILDRLLEEGLVTTIQVDTHWKYRLTEHGKAVVRESSPGLASAGSSDYHAIC